MAKRKSSTRKRAKASVIPAETTLRYDLPGDGTNVYIDLMRDLSRINRRGMNQGQVLQITDITIKQDTAQNNKSLEANVQTAPLTWVAAQAYMKGREAWMLQQRNVRQETGQTGIRPAYEDFKIYLDAAHAAGGVVLDPLDAAGNPYNAGEWNISKFVVAFSDENPEVVREPTIHLIGADNGSSTATPPTVTSVGLIKAYEDSRATVSAGQPNVPGTANYNIYTLMTSGQDEGVAKEVIANMEDENDSPPYDIDHYPGGPVNAPTTVTKCLTQSTYLNPIVHTGGLTAMCGLLKIFSQGRDMADGTTTTIGGTVLITVAHGPKKGLLSMNVGDLV